MDHIKYNTKILNTGFKFVFISIYEALKIFFFINKTKNNPLHRKTIFLKSCFTLMSGKDKLYFTKAAIIIYDKWINQTTIMEPTLKNK